MKSLTCPVCGREGMSMLTTHLKKAHGISKSEALDMFPGIKLVSDELRKQQKATLDHHRKILWDDPDHIEKMRESGRKSMEKNINSSPKKSEWASDAAKSLHEQLKQRPDYHEHMSARAKKAWDGDTKRREEQSARLREWWKDPEYREARLKEWDERLAKAWEDPEVVARMGFKPGTLIEYETPDGQLLRMRSNWEVWVAELLDKYGIEYQYEELVVKYEYEDRTRSYITDFYLPEYNLVIEVKPKEFINDLAITKLNKCKDLGYRTMFITQDNLFDDYEGIIDLIKSK